MVLASVAGQGDVVTRRKNHSRWFWLGMVLAGGVVLMVLARVFLHLVAAAAVERTFSAYIRMILARGWFWLEDGSE